jgi:hypothetical protein
LEKEVSSLRGSVKVIDFKSSLQELRGKISRGLGWVEKIDEVIDVADSRLFNQRRVEVLESTPEKVISLDGIDPREAGDIFSYVLNNDDDDNFKPECDLKELCVDTRDIPNQKLPESIEIAEKLIESLKDKSKVSDLIQFCSRDSSKVQSLFAIVHYLGLDGFQDEHLEPFNNVFPRISLNQIPKTVIQLNLTANEFNTIDFSKFTNLEVLYLIDAKGLTAAQFNALPVNIKASMEILDLTSTNVTNFDFSGFTHLKDLCLSGIKGLTATQFNTISSEAKASIEILNLEAKAFIKTFEIDSVDVTGFDFSELTNLKHLNLSGVRGLTAEQFNAIPEKSKASIERLYLRSVDVADFDFSGFTGKIIRE